MRHRISKIESDEIRTEVGIPVRESRALSYFQHKREFTSALISCRPSRPATAGGTPALLVHKLPAVANVVRQDVLAEAIDRGVKSAAAIDLGQLLDEIDEHRIGRQHEGR